MVALAVQLPAYASPAGNSVAAYATSAAGRPDASTRTTSAASRPSAKNPAVPRTASQTTLRVAIESTQQNTAVDRSAGQDRTAERRNGSARASSSIRGNCRRQTAATAVTLAAPTSVSQNPCGARLA